MAARGSNGVLGGSAWGREGLHTWKQVPLLRPSRRNEAAHRTVKKKMGQKRKEIEPEEEREESEKEKERG